MFQSNVQWDFNTEAVKGDSFQERAAIAVTTVARGEQCHNTIRAHDEYAALAKFLKHFQPDWNILSDFCMHLSQSVSGDSYLYSILTPAQLNDVFLSNLN